MATIGPDRKITVVVRQLVERDSRALANRSEARRVPRRLAMHRQVVGLADLKRSQGKECKSAGLEFEQTSDVGMSALIREIE